MEYVTIKLPINVGEKLKEIAKENCRSMSSQITYLLKKYTEEEETFEEYFERNNLQKILEEAEQGKNCVEFDSWENAKQFLHGLEK